MSLNLGLFYKQGKPRLLLHRAAGGLGGGHECGIRPPDPPSLTNPLPRQLLSSSACQPVSLCPQPCQGPPLATPAWGQPGLEDTEATSSVWQGQDSSSPQAPNIESQFGFQLFHGGGPELSERVSGS